MASETPFDYRVEKSGFAKEAQEKLERNFEPEEAAKCLKWIKLVTNIDEIPDSDSVDADVFYNLVYEGTILCKLINVLMPGKVNFESKMFQNVTLAAFQQARERERVATFLNACRDYGVPNAYLFQTDALYERTNLVQVLICIRALGMEAQSKEDYTGPDVPKMWPKKCEENKRNFSEEQMRAGESIIGLQMGTNKCANASGVSFGKQRMILD
ncbi:myophilin-like [Tubulanus polymorphus]|uniref:myophilin-like n=1 Tax=Tubulanus polymorphus TaxID=672921 RepID=UPI003DA62491